MTTPRVHHAIVLVKMASRWDRFTGYKRGLGAEADAARVWVGPAQSALGDPEGELGRVGASALLTRPCY